MEGDRRERRREGGREGERKSQRKRNTIMFDLMAWCHA